MPDILRSSIRDYRRLTSPCKIVGAACIFALSANSLNHVSSILESFFSVEPANQSESREEFRMKATGVCAPDARIREVSLSLCSMEIQWPSTTRSKSPSLKRSIASPTESADTTKYPADLQTLV